MIIFIVGIVLHTVPDCSAFDISGVIATGIDGDYMKKCWDLSQF